MALIRDSQGQDIRFELNGESAAVCSAATTTLAEALAGSAAAVNRGCDAGTCGSCLVRLDGSLVRSCSVLAASCAGSRIETAAEPEGSTLRSAGRWLSACSGLQCGFCTPAVVQVLADLGPAADSAAIDERLSDVICRCTGYTGVKAAAAHMIAGDPAPEHWHRREDERLVTGRGRFVGRSAGTEVCHAVIVRAEGAGEVRSFDFTECVADPAVLSVLTAEDLTDAQNLLHPGLSEEPLLAVKARYRGQPIAVVVARTAEAARRARARLRIEWQPAPDKPSPVDGANVAADDPRWLAELTQSVRALESDAMPTGVLVHASFTIPRQGGLPLETRGLIARSVDGGLVVEGMTKHPLANRDHIARVTGLAAADITVPSGDIGGSFGVKGEVYPEDLLIPLLAVRLGCSLAWIESRAEHAVGTNQSRAQHWEVDVVTDGDGILLAAQIEIIADAGAYPRPLTTLVPYLASAMFPGPYRLPWYRARVRPVLSTRPPIGTVRAPGRYEANAVREHVLERVAARLGLSPDEVRRRNLLTQGDMPYDTGTLNEGPVHYDTGDFRAAFESALLSQPRVASDSADGLRRAVATIPFVEKAGLGGAERATAWANADGTVGVGVASAPSGQSHATTFAVAAARTLGIDPERVSVEFDYSGVEGSPASIGTFASRGAMHTGNAVEAACRALDVQLRERTGRSLAALTPAELARLSPRAEAIGRFDTDGHTYPYGAVTCAVAIDPELYTVRVEYLSVHCDVGVPLDDGVVRGQLIGGAVQGISATLGEAFHYTADGKPMNTTLETYPLVRATDVPPVRITLLGPAPPTHRSAHNPLGVKGIGEAGMAASGSALTAAVTRALPALREGLSSLPLTPSTLWVAGLRGGAEQDAPTEPSGEK